MTRTPETLSRVPQAIGVVGERDITRAQPTLTADEALNNVPGVYVQNRSQYSQGQRIEIRGAGARAQFGARGVKVLLDGIPQTLPDGQSQLTNVDYGALDKIEVLRGPASSLYGNASGGVVSLHTQSAGPEAVLADGPLPARLVRHGQVAGDLDGPVGQLQRHPLAVALHLGRLPRRTVPPTSASTTSA